MIRLFFLIRSLGNGGAERQLVALARGLDKRRFAVTVAAFYDGGELRSQLEDLQGVRVLSLGKKGRWDVVSFLLRLWREARRARPDIVHGYMGVANELALLVGRLAGGKVVWGLRASYRDFSHYDWVSRLSFRVGATLSRFADLIIVNSWAGLRHHASRGYAPGRMIVIPNGIDTERFRPDLEAGRAMRAAWGVPAGAPLVGLVGRLDPVKDHPTFLKAAVEVVRQASEVRFVCIGGGPARYRETLEVLSRELDLSNHLIWVGDQSDMRAAFNALDLLVLSSHGEGFPNVVGEAMACGVPCVVTDVGDAGRIVGDTGLVVPPREPGALAQGIIASLRRTDRNEQERRARSRIEAEFPVHRLVAATEAELTRLAS